MTMRPMRFAVAALALCAAAACGDGTGPKAGDLNLALTGPVPARAVQLRVVGPHTGATAGGANVRIFVTPLGGDTAMVAVVANAGHTLSESNIVTLSVPDVGAASTYVVTILQVASASYALQNAGAYTVTVQ